MGVRRAVVETMKAAETEKEIVTIGELVHNPEVIRSLAEHGVYAVDSPAQAGGGTVIIRSHGVAPRVYRELAERGLKTVDLTCPFVKRLHDLVASYSATGKPVVLVGGDDHPEVLGTIGWCGATVYTVHDGEGAENLPEMDEALAVSQTTFPHEEWEAILAVLRRKVKNLTVEDTICTATVLRQSEARQLAAQADAMLVVGGLKSANTRKLYETCKRICRRTLLVERAADIPPGFADIHTETIGITAGASTPDWSLKEVVTRMTDKEQMDQRVSGEEADKNSFMADVEATLVKIRPGQSVTGTVVQITDDEICVNIGFKSDGLIKREDLITEDVKLGDEIEVEVVKVNDGEGNVLLSQRNILTRKAYAALVEKYEKGEFVEGIGKEVVKGGLICNVDGIRAFVPASQLSNRYVEKIGEFVGQTLKLKIIEVDDQKRRIVASRKAVLKEEATARKAEVWANLKEGEVIKGIVRRLTDFGAFVDIGGVDGLIHVTDLSWAHVKHPSEIVHPDQEVDVKILSLDPERERIQLGLKQLQPKPWDLAPVKYPEGSTVTGKVVRITTFGAFVELEPGVDGLVHISQCALTRINKVEDAVNVGDIVNVKVLSVDPEARRISLSIRALLEEERREAAAEATEQAGETPEGEEAEAVAVDVQAMGRQLEEEARQQEALQEEPKAPAAEEKPAEAEAPAEAEEAAETEEAVKEEAAAEAEDTAEEEEAKPAKKPRKAKAKEPEAEEEAAAADEAQNDTGAEGKE